MTWTTLLRRLEREFDGLPPRPSREDVRARLATERRTQERRDQRLTVLGAWVRVVLIAVLAAAIYFWPYPRACGLGLFAYLGVEGLIVAGGLWVFVWTWRARTGFAHAMASAIILWGCVLIGAQVLPRVGYAKVENPRAVQWSCVGTPVGR